MNLRMMVGHTLDNKKPPLQAKVRATQSVGPWFEAR